MISSTSAPKMMRGYEWPLAIPRFRPNSVGESTLRPPSPPVKPVQLNTSASIVNANASVTTARFTPRRRSAGSPINNPSGTAARLARMIENGKPMPRFELRWVRMNALTPANDICASDTWPT